MVKAITRVPAIRLNYDQSGSFGPWNKDTPTNRQLLQHYVNRMGKSGRTYYHVEEGMMNEYT